MDSRNCFPTTRDLPETRLRRVSDALLNLLYPDSCLICSAPVHRAQDCSVCAPCWSKVRRLGLRRPWCPSCGLPFAGFELGQDHLCGGCAQRTPPYSGARSFGLYSAEMRCLVQAFKFRGRRNLAGLLGPLLAEAFTESWSRADIDVIVPVPLHPGRKRERGFNQSGLLADGLGALLGMPVDHRALVRVRRTVPQVGLTDPERVRNVRRAFACGTAERIGGKRVLLVDDVMTTGATVESAALALMRGGAWRVSVLTAARAVTGME